MQSPPESTLFPYTTLFRSKGKRNADTGISQRDKSPGRYGFRPGEDRKSTRLNSSHITISYAVFCLKKKNHHFISFVCVAPYIIDLRNSPPALLPALLLCYP